MGDGDATHRSPGTGRPQALRLLRGSNLLGHRFGPIQRQAHMMVFLLAEQGDPAVPVHQHGKGGRLYPPHIQGAMVEDGEQAACIDTNEPVRLLAAERRLIQRVIFPTGAQVGKALPDRRVLHRRNPEAGEGLGASGSLIDQPENQLALPPGVAGVDKLRHIQALHEVLQILEGVLFALRQHITEGLWQDGKVVILPLLIGGVIPGCIHRGHQVSHTPGNDEPIPFKTAIGPGCDTQGRRNGFRNTRFLADHQLHFVSSVSSGSGASSLIYSSSSSKS